MAAFDNTGSVEGVNVSTLSFAFTTSGNDRALAVGVHVLDSPTAALVSTITYNSVSLGTEIANVLNPSYTRTQAYCLAGPASGSNTLAVTMNGASEFHLVLGAISATGVNQTTPVRSGSLQTQNADSASPSLTISSAAGDLVVDFITVGQSNVPGVAPAAGAGQTSRYTQTGSYSGVGGSTEPGASSVTMTWTTTGIGAPELAYIGFSLQDVGGGGGGGQPPRSMHQYRMRRAA